MSPTQRSLKRLRGEGWMVAIVEKFNHFAKVRQDVFGFGDLLAVKGDSSMLVQCTTGGNVSARRKKIEALPAARVWLSPTRQIALHGWRKLGPRGKRKVWVCREVFL